MTMAVSSEGIGPVGAARSRGSFASAEAPSLRGAVPRSYARSEILFSPGSPAEHVYLLERGMVRIFRISESGAETTFYYVSAGEFFGAVPLMNGGDENFAQALRPSRVWKIPRGAFERALLGGGDLLREVTRQIGRRLQLAENRLEDLVFRDVGARVARVLLELAERFGETDGEGDAESARLELPVTQADLATLVGSTRQSVNASLRQLEATGLIAREERRVVRFCPRALRRAASATQG